MAETGWTAEEWRELHALSVKLAAQVVDLNERLTRIEDRLKWSRKPQPQQRKHAG